MNGTTGLKKVLIVDDEATIAMLIEKVLTKENFECTKVKNGLIARNLLETGEKFDLIISDHDMPEMCGLDLAVWMRESGENSEVPFLIVSAADDCLKFNRAVASNILNGFLSKPFVLDDLVKLANDLTSVAASATGCEVSEEVLTAA